MKIVYRVFKYFFMVPINRYASNIIFLVHELMNYSDANNNKKNRLTLSIIYVGTLLYKY